MDTAVQAARVELGWCSSHGTGLNATTLPSSELTNKCRQVLSQLMNATGSQMLKLLVKLLYYEASGRGWRHIVASKTLIKGI